MAKHLTGIWLLISFFFAGNLFSQNVNGDKLTFPNGKTEWSDTIYKKLRTKQMVKEGVSAVLLGIRFKSDQETDTGKWYLVEITNKSQDTKVKFKVRAGRNQEVFTVKLNPGQTKNIRKFYWTTGKNIPAASDKEQQDYIYYPLEELLER